MPTHYFIADAFTARPFSGNPAAVVPLDCWRDAAWLQNVALEMNLSETAYLVPNSTGYDLRWFTPKVEVDLCGHATLASAIVLSHFGKLADGAGVDFSTRSGILHASRNGTRFQLDFPSKPAEPAAAPAGLVEALNAAPRYVGRSFGDDETILAEYAWFRRNTRDNDEPYAHRVGQKKPNPWGLYDVHGNVWEYCRDQFASVLPGGIDPEVTENSMTRILRGGGWRDNAMGCRSLAYNTIRESESRPNVGFRVALVPIQSAK
jgi:hypothetical protein